MKTEPHKVEWRVRLDGIFEERLARELANHLSKNMPETMRITVWEVHEWSDGSGEAYEVNLATRKGPKRYSPPT